MQREIAGARRHLEGAVAAVVDRRQPAVDLGADAARRHELRNALVGGIDDAADGLAAVAQRRRAAHDLDLIGR